MDADAGAEMRSQRLGPGAGAIDERELKAAAEERVDHRARRAAGANHDSDAAGRIPARRALVEMRQIAEIVGVATDELAVLEPHGIDGPDGVGRALAAIDQTERSFLVGLGDVASDVTAAGEIAKKFGEGFRRNVGARVVAGDTERLEPIAVHHGGARLRNRMAHDAGAGNILAGHFLVVLPKP